jgi:hypothetical protein
MEAFGFLLWMTALLVVAGWFFFASKARASERNRRGERLYSHLTWWTLPLLLPLAITWLLPHVRIEFHPVFIFLAMIRLAMGGILVLVGALLGGVMLARQQSVASLLPSLLANLLPFALILFKR